MNDRGSYISKSKAEKIDKIDQKISDIISSRYEHYTRPVMAFVTFTSQEARERCLHYFGSEQNIFSQTVHKNEKIEVFDQALEITEALDPSNIIWENL